MTQRQDILDSQIKELNNILENKHSATLGIFIKTTIEYLLNKIIDLQLQINELKEKK